MKQFLQTVGAILGIVAISSGVIVVHDWLLIRAAQNAVHQVVRAQQVERLARQLWQAHFYGTADAGPRHWQYVPASMNDGVQGEWLNVLDNPPYPERAAADWQQTHDWYIQQAERQIP